MKRLLLVLTLLIIPFSLFASNNDITKSKGTDQDVIVQLTPSPEQTDVSRYTKIEAVFNIVLDSKHVKKHDVKLKCLSCEKKKEKIKGTVSYVEGDKKVQFTPETPLIPGIYEVEFKSLKADKAHKDTKIKEIKYRFIVIEELLQSITITPQPLEIKEGEHLSLQAVGHYDNGNERNITMQVQWFVADTQMATIDASATLTAVKEGTTTLTAQMESVEAIAEITVYKEINGYRLPPEPDAQVNNSTLLGIDSNDNGVRDDVERWIYQTYKDKHPIHIDIAMQAARAYKKVLETPEKAKEMHDSVSAPSYCESYFKIYAKYFNEPILVSKDITNKYFRKKIYFTTNERKNAYIIYDRLLSGDSYTTPKIGDGKKLCDFNTSAYEEKE